MEQEGGLSPPARTRRERVPRPAIGLNACRIEDARVDPDLCQDPEIAAEVIVPLGHPASTVEHRAAVPSGSLR